MEARELDEKRCWATETRLLNTEENYQFKKALRYNSGKPKWSLIHYESLLPLVRVLEYGEAKYSTNNWMNPFNTRELLDSLMRHVVALMDGEQVDKESGLPHIGHVMANAMFYSYHEKVDSDSK